MSKVKGLREAAQRVADRLEAWADTHEGLAGRSMELEEQRDHLNTMDNYRILANDLRDAIAESKP